MKKIKIKRRLSESKKHISKHMETNQNHPQTDQSHTKTDQIHINILSKSNQKMPKTFVEKIRISEYLQENCHLAS